MSEDRWRTRLRWVVVHPHDPAAGVQRATLLAVPGRRRPRPRGWPGQAGDAAVAARVVEELERGPGGDGGQPWAAHGWFAEAERWLRSTMERLGRALTGPVRQARSGGSPVSCAPPPATATSGSRPTRPRPCSSTRGWSWAPAPGGQLPVPGHPAAGVVDRFVLASTGGPVEHVRTWCLEGHGFTQRVDALVAWPMVRARRPLETG
jgi:hypothetical protein